MMRRPLALASVLAVALLAAGCGYNTIQTLDEQVNQAEGQVKVTLQRRADLIPNLVEVVKGVAKQESTVFLGVAEARARLAGAAKSGDVAEMASADAVSRQALGRLLALVEAYPELKSNENFRDLQAQLEGTENRIAIARRRYIEAVQGFNNLVTVPPTSFTNSLIYHKERKPQFTATTPGAEKPPEVKF